MRGIVTISEPHRQKRESRVYRGVLGGPLTPPRKPRPLRLLLAVTVSADPAVMEACGGQARGHWRRKPPLPVLGKEVAVEAEVAQSWSQSACPSSVLWSRHSRSGSEPEPPAP